MRYQRSKPTPSLGLDLTPMVDVMSTLLIFFLMTTTFLVVQPGFTVQPPQASAGAPQPPENITVLVSRDGRVAIGEKVISMNELIALVSAHRQNQPIIFIKADKETLHGRVVEVIDSVKKAGAGKISIAVEQKHQ
jgi:biopolymer transport protein ExbD